MNNNLFLLSLLFFTYFCSCSKQINYNPDYEDKIVVNASISPQKGIEVKLSKSVSPAETQYYTRNDLKLENATVELYRSDTLLAILTEIDRGIYKVTNNLNIRADEEFYLKVYIENLPNVTTEKVIIPKALTNTNYIFEQFDESDGQITVSFKNNKFTSFFATEIFGINEEEQLLDINWWFTNLDDELCEFGGGSTYRMINTSCLENTVISMEALLFDLDNSGHLNDWNHLRSPVKKIKLNLKNVNEDLFRYGQTYYTSNGFFESVESETQPTFTNINGGYGIFAAENMVSYVIEL